MTLKLGYNKTVEIAYHLWVTSVINSETILIYPSVVNCGSGLKSDNCWRLFATRLPSDPKLLLPANRNSTRGFISFWKPQLGSWDSISLSFIINLYSYASGVKVSPNKPIGLAAVLTRCSGSLIFPKH